MGQRQRPKGGRTPLSPDERDGIVLAVNSAFRKLKNLYFAMSTSFADRASSTNNSRAFRMRRRVSSKVRPCV
jgi:hypothetical protein